MAKPYKLMKVREGEYNIRDRSTDVITGTILQRDGKWNVSVFGNSQSLASKDKAVGFVRGVYATNSGSTSSPVSSELKEDIVDITEFVSTLLADIQEFKQRLGA